MKSTASANSVKSLAQDKEVNRLLKYTESDQSDPHVSLLRRSLLIFVFVISVTYLGWYIACHIYINKYSDRVDDIATTQSVHASIISIASAVRSLDFIRQGALSTSKSEDHFSYISSHSISISNAYERLWDGVGDLEGDLLKQWTEEVQELDPYHKTKPYVASSWSMIHAMQEVPALADMVALDDVINVNTATDRNVYNLVRNGALSISRLVNSTSFLYQRDAIDSFEKEGLFSLIFVITIYIGTCIFLFLIFIPSALKLGATSKEVLNIFLDLAPSVRQTFMTRVEIREKNLSRFGKMRTSELEASFMQMKLNGPNPDDPLSGAVIVQQHQNETPTGVMSFLSSLIEQQNEEGEKKAHHLNLALLLRGSFLVAVTLLFTTLVFIYPMIISESAQLPEFTMKTIPTELNYAGLRLAASRKLFFDLREYVATVKNAGLSSSDGVVFPNLSATALEQEAAFLRHVNFALQYGDSHYGLSGNSRRYDNLDSLQRDSACVSTSSAGCSLFYDGLMESGLDSALSEYMRVIVQVTNSDESSNLNTTSDLHSYFTSDPDFTAVEMLDEFYISEALEHAVDLLRKHANGVTSDLLSGRRGLMFSFMFLLPLIVYMFMLPSLEKFDKDIKQTRSMLLILPVEVMLNTPSIREYIQRLRMEKRNRYSDKRRKV